jgi:hypothetical protein
MWLFRRHDKAEGHFAVDHGPSHDHHGLEQPAFVDFFDSPGHSNQ